jgi:hypothetical protein
LALALHLTRGKGGGPNTDQERRLRIRQLIEAGHLPSSDPERIWAGPGHGRPCTVCGAPIASTDFEFEVPGASVAFLDRRCYALFVQEVSRPT